MKPKSSLILSLLLTLCALATSVGCQRYYAVDEDQLSYAVSVNSSVELSATEKERRIASFLDVVRQQELTALLSALGVFDESETAE